MVCIPSPFVELKLSVNRRMVQGVTVQTIRSGDGQTFPKVGGKYEVLSSYKVLDAMPL